MSSGAEEARAGNIEHEAATRQRDWGEGEDQVGLVSLLCLRRQHDSHVGVLFEPATLISEEREVNSVPTAVRRMFLVRVSLPCALLRALALSGRAWFHTLHRT